MLNIYRLSINVSILHKTYSMRKRKVSVLVLSISGLVTAFLFILFGSVTAIRNLDDREGGYSIDGPQSDTAFAGIFSTPELNDSLPHYIYRKMEDSAKRVKTEQEIDNLSVGGDGMSIGVFGVYAMNRHQNTWNAMAENNKDQYYYIGIDGYRLDRESKFFIQNETYNLAYVKWDSAKKDPNSNRKHGHYERKEIPVRYSAPDERVLIPVTKFQYNALRSLFYLLWFVLLVGMLYFFLGIPVQVLLNISRGLAFDENNVRYFNVIARLFFVLGVLYFVGPYILDLFLRFIIPADFKRPPFTEGLGSVCWLFVLSIAVSITGKAFQKGNTMQKEQDLTI